MGNAPDTSAAFHSTISKEHDVVMASLYTVFCEFEPTRELEATKTCAGERLLTVLGVFSLHSCTVPPGQLHSATCCISQAINLETSRVLHHQSVHQRPWDDAGFVPTGDSISLFTQVPHITALLLTHVFYVGKNSKFSNQISCFKMLFTFEIRHIT